jgi:hypothetical protein
MRQELTELEIGLDILLPNIRRHGNNWYPWGNHTDHGRGRHAVQVGHDDVHENQIEPLSVSVDLLNRFETVALRHC